MTEESEEFQFLLRAARETGLPGLEVSTHYALPALKVAGRYIALAREPGVIAIWCEFEEKPILMALAPEVYFETDHFKGYPSILVRYPAVTLEELADRLEHAWRLRAPKKLLSEIEKP